MTYLMLFVVLVVLVTLVMPLAASQIRRRGTVREPHKITMIGGILVGVAVNFFTPVGDFVWVALQHPSLEQSRLGSRAIGAGIVVGMGIVVALYVEALLSSWRGKSE